MRIIHVRMTKAASERAVLHETNAAHPLGYAAIDTPGTVYEVAETAAVMLALARGLIERVEDAPAEEPAMPEVSEPPKRRRGR